MRNTTAHAADIEGFGEEVVPIEVIPGSVIMGTVNTVAVQIIQAVAVAVRSAHVAFCGNVHVIQCPFQTFSFASYMVALATADDAAQVHGKRVEKHIEAPFFPVFNVIVGADKCFLKIPVVAGELDTHSSGDIADGLVLVHIRVLLGNVGNDVQRAQIPLASAKTFLIAPPICIPTTSLLV